MIDHLTIGVNDFEKSLDFYDKVLSALQIKRLKTAKFEPGGVAGYGGKQPEFWICSPLDESRGVVASNGSHVAFKAALRSEVDQFHEKALDSGGMDDGEPGLRPDNGPGYYAAYIRDPDGHKIEAVCRS